MMDFVAAYRPLFDLFLINAGYALSQYLVLRAGMFSVATAAIAGIGAYAAAILAVRAGLPAPLSLLGATLAGTLAAALLAVPLARLRGVYQAIATLAFVQIVVSLILEAEDLTGGAMGFNGIPKQVGTLGLLAAVAGTVYVLASLNAGRVGRTFEAMRQDEAVAATLGVDVSRYQALALMLSGAIAGLFGGLGAFYSYSLTAEQFGFPLVVAILSFVVLGGRRSITGPIVGTAILLALPELSRPLAQQRTLLFGAILILVMNFLPRGIYDTLAGALRRRRVGDPRASGAREPAPEARP